MNLDLVVLRAVLVRAVQTAAQAALATIGAGTLDVLSADWAAIGSVAAGAAFLSALKSIAIGVPEVPSSATISSRLHGMAEPLPEDNLDHDADDDGEPVDYTPPEG